MASARSLSQFQKAFSDEASCAAFMVERRWPDGFVCPACSKRRVAALKSRPADDRDDEIARLRAKVGELTMDNELLLQRCRADRPFAPRRRRLVFVPR